MRLALVVVALVAALGQSAAADGIYVTESFGGADVKDDLGSTIESTGRVRLSLGVRRGAWALEGWFAADFATSSSRDAVDEYGYYDSAAIGYYGLDLKHMFPVSKHVELYLRGTASHGFIEGGRYDDYGGRGLGVGAGVQLKGKVPALGFLAWPLFFTNWGPKVTAAVFADTGYDFYRFHRDNDIEHGASVDGQLSQLRVGFAVGSDF
jgi:hypothetical protein